MSFLERAIKNGISKGIGDAVSKAVQQAVEPKATAYANKVAAQYDKAAQDASQQSQEAAKGVNSMKSALANLQHSMEGYATEMSKTVKVCPNCDAATTADKKFCPNCGAKLPEQTLAQGAVCPACGKQNTLGTKFCQDCGTKLPSAIAEEKAEADKKTAVLAQWAEELPAYPVWNCGGTEFRLEKYDDYYVFTALLENSYAAQNAVNRYRETLMQNGFRQAGEYPIIEHLYKKTGGVCYHVDTEHCFEGDDNMPSIYFNISEPAGGYDYVKPAAPKTFGLKDLFR